MKQVFIFILFSISVVCSPLYSQVNTDKMLIIGKNALYFDDYILSIQYFNQVIKAKPYLAEPYLYRAIAKFNLEDYKGAETDIGFCIERNPFLVYAYQCRGASRQNLQNFDGAIADYNKGLEYRPEDKQMLINLGIAYIQAKKYKEAEPALTQLLKVYPKFTEGYMARGSLYLEQKDTLKALSDFNTSVEIDKYYAPVYGQRGIVYYQMDSLNKALTDFNETIRLEPRQIGNYINRGLVRYHLNDLRGTMSDYDAVVNLETNNIIARFNRGLLRAQLGDNNRAIEDFNVVINQEPDNFIAVYNRAMLREEIGDSKGAIEDLDAVISEYPNFFEAYYFRSSIKRKMRNMVGADKDYWYAYDLEQKLQKEKQAGKVVTGKGSSSANASDNDKDDKTREKSDKNIEKFNRLMVYDKEEEQSLKYKNEIRGKVQNRQVKIELEPQLIITYYEWIDGGLDEIFHFSKLVSDYNKKRVLGMQLKIINKEAALTDDQAEIHFKSIDEYSLKISNNPSDVNAYFGRALDFMVLQDLSESLADYNRVIALDSNFLMAYFNRADVRFKQLEISSLEAANQNDNKDKIDLSLDIQVGKNKSVKSSNSYVAPASTNVLSSKDSKRAFEYELILHDYTACLEIDPDFVFAYFNRGNIRCIQKDFRGAIVDYNDAVKRDPEFAEAYFNRGLTHLYLGETEKGIADLSKAGELGLINAYGIIKKMTAD